MVRKQSLFLDIGHVVIKDVFFSPVQRLVCDVVLPYEEKALKDEVPGVEKSHSVANFRIAAGDLDEEYYGRVFQDSDLAKWIEAAAYALTLKRDPELEARVDEIIDFIRRAQLPDGYLDTYFITGNIDRRWQNLADCHELYCAGHMTEAAIAYYEATGKDTLLNVVRKLCDHIDARFGKGKVTGIPGHEEIELALIRLYRLTGEERYLRLAGYFLDERGKNPEFFHEEAAARGWDRASDYYDVFPPEYFQIHQPVREQRTAEGHAVRCMYLLTAMADYSALISDDDMWEACCAIWDNMTGKRMYLTGGIGSNQDGEAFTADYDLPNDSIYAETCASIGVCLAARKMLEAKPNAAYADIMERELYNGAVSGIGSDGQHFFYVNPLEVVPGISGKLWGYRHVLPERTGWYDCACCPPNLARLFTSLGGFIYSESEETRTIYSHLFIGGTAEFTTVSGLTVMLETRYPWDGNISYSVGCLPSESEFTFAIRCPGWCRDYTLSVNGAPCEAELLEGYLRITRSWRSGDTIEYNLQMPVEKIYANPAVRADAGSVAFMRGPVVYAFEGNDNPGPLSAVRIPRDSAGSVLPYDAELLGGIVPIGIDAIRLKDSGVLYSAKPPEGEKVTLRAIPYYVWGNRGLTEMRVWMPEAAAKLS